MAERLLTLVPEADPSCRNPSRLTRIPGPTRPDTGLKQKLMEIRARVSNAELETLLPQVETYTPGPPRSPEEIRRYVSPLLIWASQSPDEVMAEKDIRGRNAFFYWLGQRMEDLSMEHDKRAEYVYRTWNNLRDRSDFSINEALAAARVRNHGWVQSYVQNAILLSQTQIFISKKNEDIYLDIANHAQKIAW
jgi:hypothetical protein